MKRFRRLPQFSLFPLLLALASAPALAHEESAPHASAPVTPNAPNAVDASVVVEGTVSALKTRLYRVETWSETFGDVRSVERRPDGIWSIDFRGFGHPHAFTVQRAPAGVVLDLAMPGHGDAQLAYQLTPVDATHSRLTIHFWMTTPPQLTATQVHALLAAKAERDVRDFAKVMARHVAEVTP